MIRFASFVAAAFTLCCVGSLSAQTTALGKQLARIDVGVSGAGEITRSTNGLVTPTSAPNAGQSVSLDVSNTVGALVNVRYVAKPFVGVEFNYSYARYTDNFSYPPPTFGVQTDAQEFTLGYLLTPGHQFHGLQPFASVGLGSTEFKPTQNGGVGLKPQARMTYYYSAGLQQDVFGHLGIRAGFRQAFFLAPDYQQNYFENKQHTFTSEPFAGFYVRF